MTYDELVEKVARAMKPTISSIVDRLIEAGADRLEAIQLLPLQEATVAIATIREALQEPTEGMIAAVLKHYGTDFDNEFAVDNINDDWSKMLAASPLGEQSE